jgi:hypothetical protein
MRSHFFYLAGSYALALISSGSGSTLATLQRRNDADAKSSRGQISQFSCQGEQYLGYPANLHSFALGCNQKIEPPGSQFARALCFET